MYLDTLDKRYKTFVTEVLSNVCIGFINIYKQTFFYRKTVNMFLAIHLNMCCGAQKNRLNKAVLLSTHNICFG